MVPLMPPWDSPKLAQNQILQIHYYQYDTHDLDEISLDPFEHKFAHGFESESAARSALRKAKSAGFNTAFLVVEENGELIKIK